MATSYSDTYSQRVIQVTNSNPNRVNIVASASMGTDLDWTLPPNSGTNGYTLTTDGTGVLSWSGTVGSKLLDLNSVGAVGGGPGQTYYFIVNGTTATEASSKTYIIGTVTRIDVYLSAGFGNSVAFNVQRNGVTQATFNTAVTGGTAISVAYVANDYLNLTMVTSNITSKVNVNVLLTYA